MGCFDVGLDRAQVRAFDAERIVDGGVVVCAGLDLFCQRAEPPLDAEVSVGAGKTACVSLGPGGPANCASEARISSPHDVSMKVVTPPGWLADRQMYFATPSTSGSINVINCGSKASPGCRACQSA